MSLDPIPLAEYLKHADVPAPTPLGRCQWLRCENLAMLVHHFNLKPPGFLNEIPVDVELCGGHTRAAQNLGRVVLDWQQIHAVMDSM